LVRFTLKIKFGNKIHKSHKYDTYPANEAVRMPLTIKRRYIIFHDSAIATTALGCEHVEVILAAVGLAVSFVEALLAELLAALSAKEVLGVPSLLQGGHTFLKEKHFFQIHQRDFAR
ncbi:hypothetical protein ALC57_03560, partial [Trachymyrmex cornetzi]